MGNRIPQRFSSQRWTVKATKTLFIKKTNRQSYLHLKCDHPALLKKSVPYSQTLYVKRIFSTNKEFRCNCKVLQEQYTERSHDHPQLKPNLRRLNF